MSLTWDPASMSTGVAEIDLQHRELIARLNQLFAHMHQGRGTEQVESLLGFCADYARKHFAHEESCMRRLACPAAEQNERAHRQFHAVFDAFRERLRSEGPSVKLTIEVQQQLSAWLRNHIVRTDTQLRPCAAGEHRTGG